MLRSRIRAAIEDGPVARRKAILQELVAEVRVESRRGHSANLPAASPAGSCTVPTGSQAERMRAAASSRWRRAGRLRARPARPPG